jgi:hypothetical protein
MPAQRVISDPAREKLQARAARARERVASRIATARLAIIAGVAALTCALALFMQSIAPGSSSASTRGSASVTGSVQPLFHGGGASGSRASAPSASSGQGDVVSGGS